MELFLPILKVTVLREVILYIHMFAVVMGMGAAFFAQYLFFQQTRRTVEIYHIELFEITAKIVTYSLIAMYVTGIGFLVFYYFADPSKLYNPKIYAKVLIVIILTINGMMLHTPSTRALLKNIGHPFLENLSLIKVRYFLFRGTISFVFWNAAFFLGVFRTLNNTVSFEVFLALIILALVLIKISTHYLALLIYAKPVGEIVTAYEEDEG